MFARGNRYERRSRSRARRVERRLEQAQRAQTTLSRPAILRHQLGQAPPPKFRAARVAIFVVSLLLGTLLAQAVTAAVIAWWNDRPTSLVRVAVQGTERLTGEDVAWATGLEKGSPLDALSASELEAQVVAHPWIREARVALLPTGTVIIDVTERVPEAVLRSGRGDAFVDAEGSVFAPVGPAEAASASGLRLLVGNPADEAILRDGLAIAAKLAQVSLPGFEDPGFAHRGIELRFPSEATDPRHGWVLGRAGGGTEVTLGADDVAAVSDRIDRLARLLEAEPGELEETETIDLRFAGQAVLRKTSTSR